MSKKNVVGWWGGGWTLLLAKMIMEESVTVLTAMTGDRGSQSEFLRTLLGLKWQKPNSKWFKKKERMWLI